MRIHHFYPRTGNIGDHFVQRGIEHMIRRVYPEAIFELFNINSRGNDKIEFGLTRTAIDRANKQADLIVVGGSNLYEGSFGWPWGVHLEAGALESLKVPLFLLGIGSGSNFASQLHKPSTRAKREIILLNQHAAFSGARDITTFDWLQKLGIANAKLMGDPAAFIFNQPLQENHAGHILLAMPPRRFCKNKRQFLKVRSRGRGMFKALAGLARKLLEAGHNVVVVCNDPIDLPVAASFFEKWLPEPVQCPRTPEEYFALLSTARAVVSGRLHTAVVAFSLGIPFLLLDVDQRTAGFVKTYRLEEWAISPSGSPVEGRLEEVTAKILNGEASQSWKTLIEARDKMYVQAMQLLREAFAASS